MTMTTLIARLMARVGHVLGAFSYGFHRGASGLPLCFVSRAPRT